MGLVAALIVSAAGIGAKAMLDRISSLEDLVRTDGQTIARLEERSITSNAILVRIETSIKEQREEERAEARARWKEHEW